MTGIGCIVLVAALAAAEPRAAGKSAGLPRPPDDNSCAACHTDRDLWGGPTEKLFLPADALASDVHWRNGVGCQGCHGGDATTTRVSEAHAKENRFRARGAQVWAACAGCHKDAGRDLGNSVHAKPGGGDARAQTGPLDCAACHGGNPHQLTSVRDPKSPVYVGRQVNTCGRCHPRDAQHYVQSVHGRGLIRSGLRVTAVCSDCHGAHGIHRASDARSTLSPERVDGVCGKCHPYIEEQLRQSVHGPERRAGGGKPRRAAGDTPLHCTSCHLGHEIGPVETAFTYRAQAAVCGKCHTEPTENHAMSLHTALGELGYAKAPRCSDCHRAHAIQPASDARSSLSQENRKDTCGQCHANTGGGFLDFNPNADVADPHSNPIVHGVYRVLLALLIATFGISGIHSVLWLVRSVPDMARHGRPARPKPGAVVFRRFRRLDSVCHGVLVVSFLGLALTGLPLKYHQAAWAKRAAHWLGGFDATSVWHRLFAVALMALFVVNAVRLVRRYLEGRRRGTTVRQVVFGPDSPVLNRRDLGDFFRMMRWFLGLGPKPAFERWAYWEKLDFWAAQADVVIIGLTGLILWFPHLFTAALPALAINIAKVVHSTQALLATGFVFAVHLFNTQLRPDKFPADLSILTGLVTEAELREERGDYYERLRREGKLDALRRVVPPQRHLWLVTLSALAVMAVGLSLVVAIVVTAI